MITTCGKHGCEFVKEYCPECVNQKPASDWAEFTGRESGDKLLANKANVKFYAITDNVRFRTILFSINGTCHEWQVKETLEEVMEKIK